MTELPTVPRVWPVWRCPCCDIYRPLPDLWTHLMDDHGIDMTEHPNREDWLLRALTIRLVTLIEGAMADPVEYIPSRIRGATRELRAALDGRNQ